MHRAASTLYKKRLINVVGRRGHSSSTLTQSQIENISKNANVVRLVEGFRKYGHLQADLDPLGLMRKKDLPQLGLPFYNLHEHTEKIELDGILSSSKKSATVEEIVQHLRKSYCGTLTSQFVSIGDPEKEIWMAQMMESLPERKLSNEEKQKIYERMSQCEIFDHFMQKKFGSVKRYGMEGLESTAVGLEAVLNECASSGVTDVILTMAHRGRLNLLAGLLQLPPDQIFWKSKGNSEIPEGVNAIGDVLSHLGQSTTLDFGGKKLNVTMIQNPSHLEAADPVAMGKARARQNRMKDDGSKVVCVMLHGDAAFTGQGVVAETFGLSLLKGFAVGGTIHLVCNNQIGFTTNPDSGRSTRYAADVGKLVDAPLLHVNAEAPEDVAKSCTLATQYRNKFRSDVVVDIIGYRRHGHNELDEPAFTQPVPYKNIRARETVVAQYAKQLQKEGVVSESDISSIRASEEARLDQSFKSMKQPTESRDHFKSERWSKFQQCEDATQKIDTGIKSDTLQKVAAASVNIPSDFDIHPRLQKGFVQARNDAMSRDQIDWATAESLAFGSLLSEGYDVRISGQDVGRGTFSHRHIEITNQSNGSRIIPLNNLGNGKIQAVNSSLSEAAVMGFEYGYSVEDPNALCIWEAQFGDFANSAQMIIDTFVTCGESKWLKQSGLVLMLPHGYDGAGPEHSSGRIERFLQMVDSDVVDLENPRNIRPNFSVINPTTPANIFHALRRQMKSNYRLPLVIMGPKTLLRNSKAVSSVKDMSEGTHFRPVIGDTDVDPQTVNKVLFVSGKYFYDLQLERQKKNISDVAILRIEELAPFPLNSIKSELQKYPNAKRFAVVQDESQNSGAWLYLQPRLSQIVNGKLEYIGRPPCPATAVGNGPEHKRESAALLEAVFQK